MDNILAGLQFYEVQLNHDPWNVRIGNPLNFTGCGPLEP